MQRVYLQRFGFLVKLLAVVVLLVGLEGITCVAQQSDLEEKGSQKSEQDAKPKERDSVKQSAIIQHPSIRISERDGIPNITTDPDVLKVFSNLLESIAAKTSKQEFARKVFDLQHIKATELAKAFKPGKDPSFSVIVDQSNDRIVVMGTKEIIEQTDLLIKEMDDPENKEQLSIVTYQLKNADSAEVQVVLSSSKRMPENTLMSHESTNTLSVLGTKRVQEAVAKLVKSFDLVKLAKPPAATMVVAMTVMSDGTPRVWLKNQLKGSKNKLAIGDKFELAGRRSHYHCNHNH